MVQKSFAEGCKFTYTVMLAVVGIPRRDAVAFAATISLRLVAFFSMRKYLKFGIGYFLMSSRQYNCTEL